MSQCRIVLFLNSFSFLICFVFGQGQGPNQGLVPDLGLGPPPDLGLGPTPDLGLGPPPASGPTPESLYKFKKILDDKGNYELFWNIVGDTIQFEVKVRTLGYVGFGLSRDRSGRMSPADMVIGWVDKDNAYFGVSCLFYYKSKYN